MTALTKAYLAEITSGDNPTEVAGTKVDVQFNPTSLRVQLSNRTAGGQQAGAQARQRPGTGEMSVSFDLVFDTADEGSTDHPVSVLAKTQSVERFVRPRGQRAGQEAPPRVTFVWGHFQVQGTMENASIDLDFFDAGGTPLRAKVAVTIKGQDPRWVYTPAPPPPAAAGAAPGLPGTNGSGLAPGRIMQALPGESLAQVASRAGLLPSLWRALTDGSGLNPVKLSAGQEVPIPESAGRNAAAGQGAQDPARDTAALPLTPAATDSGSGAGMGAGAGAGAAAADPVRQGQALARRGGLQSAIGQQQADTHQQAASSRRASFSQASAPASPRSAVTEVAATADAADRPWGQGVPLRPRFGTPPAAPVHRHGGLPAARPLAAPRTRCACGCGGRCGSH